MTYLQSAFLGLVQGIAEFLPISSSGHLSLFQTFLGIQSAEESNLFFDVLLHLGTLISIFVVYRKMIGEMILEFFRWLGDIAHGGTVGKVPPARRMILLIVVGTLPLFVILPVKHVVEQLSSNTFFIGGALLVTGTLLYLSDRMAKGDKTERNATILDTVLVGFAQALATVPGLSRSGTTISAGLVRGFSREYAVRYSFLMSIPAVLGANILSLKDAVEAGIDYSIMPVYLVGVLVAAVSGYFAIRLVNLLSDKGKFGAFAYYCWAVGLFALIASAVMM